MQCYKVKISALRLITVATLLAIPHLPLLVVNVCKADLVISPLKTGRVEWDPLFFLQFIKADGGPSAFFIVSFS